MREASPGPALISTTVFASSASTSRKSRASAPGTASFSQCSPSCVRRTVPPEPLAQACFASRTDRPRSSDVEPLVWGTHAAASVAASRNAFIYFSQNIRIDTTIRNPANNRRSVRSDTGWTSRAPKYAPRKSPVAMSAE